MLLPTVIAQLRLVHGVIGRQLEVDLAERPDDTDNLQKTAMAYELAAIEGIDALLHPGTDQQSVDLADQAQAGAFRAYELLRVLPAPSADHERIFHVASRRMVAAAKAGVDRADAGGHAE
jgi:hypothetical protein